MSESERASGFDILLSFPPGFPESVIILSPSTASATMITFAAEDPNQPNKDGPLPATKKSIADMPLVKITDQETGLNSEAEPSSCAICLGEFEIGGEAKEMPCKHRFHPGCIDKWLGMHGTCPVCRYEMPVEEERDKGSEGDRREQRGEFRISILVQTSNEEGGASDDEMEDID